MQQNLGKRHQATPVRSTSDAYATPRTMSRNTSTGIDLENESRSVCVQFRWQMIRTMTIVQQIKRRGIRTQDEAMADHMLLTQRLEIIEHQRDVANIRNEILKDGVVRRKQKAGRHMQAAEMKVQTLQNELAEVKVLLEEQTRHANELKDAVQHRTQQWVQEQVGKTLLIGSLFNGQSLRLLCEQISNNQ